MKNRVLIDYFDEYEVEEILKGDLKLQIPKIKYQINPNDQNPKCGVFRSLDFGI